MAVRVLPLGGLGEIGMNAMAIVQGNDALLVDCGVAFADRACGADVIHPDFTELERYSVRGVVLTHGHEDHIGALPYFLRRFDVPIHGPRYALGLVEERAREHEILWHATLRETTPREAFAVGPFRVEPVRVSHSTADATALAIETEEGVVLHTGDFKLDDEPADFSPSDVTPGIAHADVERFAELGKAGVSLLLSDSTNADREGHSGSERDVAEALFRLVSAPERARGAIVVTLFASNVERLDSLGRIAKATGRKLVLVGRSMDTHVRAARRRGLLGFPSDIIWPEDRVRELRKSQVLALATGSQGELTSGLAKLARDELEGLSIGEGDTVILSSRVIPGNEHDVQRIVADFFRRGVEVRWHATDPDVHVSGHACRSEQQRMIELVQPHAFVPVHGAVHHLHCHAKLARDLGVGSVVVVENGQSVSLAANAITKDADFPVGKVFTWDKREIPAGVLGERRALGQDGIAFLSLELDANANLLARPTVIARGVMTEPALDATMKEVRAEIANALDELAPPRDKDRVAEAARLATRRALARHTGRKPVVVVSVTTRS